MISVLVLASIDLRQEEKVQSGSYMKREIEEDVTQYENVQNDQKSEIVFLRRMGKINEKLRKAAEDALRYENHK